MDIKQEIVNKRKENITKYGHTLGTEVEKTRSVPIKKFGQEPFLICEVKRRSPSKGNIAQGIDAVEQAGIYVKNGVRNISVLTEQDYFGGSLNDLIRLKKAFPEAAVLRKDFLADEEDIDISYRAGADAVLLIASVLGTEVLKNMYSKAKDLGMEVLLEVHSEEDIKKAEQVKPAITGINSRDLSTFRVDTLIPVITKRSINWETNIVFESGIRYREHGIFALANGFTGLLVGEYALKKPELVRELINCFSENTSILKKKNFWEKLYKRQKPGRPLVKICGITNREDALLCKELGADIIGFIFAPSKRRANPEIVKELEDLDILKTAVVTETPDNKIMEMLQNGFLDAVQLHGAEKPDECFNIAFPYFKALSLKTENDIDLIEQYRCPRVLVDTYSPHLKGGTGTRIPDDLLGKVKKKYPLWIAGGISPDNVKEIIDKYSPELIDASSRLEAEPGKKDHDKLKKFFKLINNSQ
jgi:indole-3-glycerol phosphate synthase/phosphoribosylanthranilate isomerase